MKIETTCKCTYCKNLVVKEDSRWVRYQCPFNPDKEYLNGMGEEPLIRNCKNFEKKFVWAEVE